MSEFSELPQQPNFKSMAAVLWIALVAAIVVTIIDWKIKQDILRLTDAFYRIYPSTMEEQHGGATPSTNGSANFGPGNHTSVLRFPVVDSNAGVETQTSPVSLVKTAEDHSADWKRFAPDIETGLESRTDENHE